MAARMRPSAVAARLVAALLGSAILILGGLLVARFTQRGILVAFDAAYAATRPELVTALKDLRLTGNRLDYRELPLDDGPSKLVSLLEGLGARKKSPRAVVVSPLLARALLEGAARNGSDLAPNLVALEWQAPGSQSVKFGTILSDPLPSFELAGRLLGSLVADYRRGVIPGRTPAPAATGALAFVPGPGRSEACVTAFEAAFTKAAGFSPAILRFPASSSPMDVESRVRSLLADGDVTAIVVAAGKVGAAALALAVDAGRVVGMTTTSPVDASLAWPLASFALHPDDLALASTLRSLDPKDLGKALSLPWKLSLLPGASALTARNIDLEKRLRVQEGSE